MKKKISVLLLVLVLIATCHVTALSALAADDDALADELCRVVDTAQLLSDSEREALASRLNEISLRQNMDVVVATTDTTDGCSVAEYADRLYDEYGFGCGEQRDGLLLLISMEERDWYISTCGYGITAFTDAGIEYIGKQIRSDLSAGSYAAAFQSYAELCDDFITQAKSGTPYNKSNLPREPLSLVWIPIAAVVGFVIAKIIVGNMKGKLKTVRKQAAANSYVKDGSMSITDSRDLFLYHTVTRSEKPKSSSSSSSTHTSSSGTTHGGGGGKF